MILERCQWGKENTGKMPVGKREHWKDASEERRSLESDIQYVFLFWDTSV